MTNLSHLPTSTLPVIRITIVYNGAGYVVRDNGGDFRTWSSGQPLNDATRDVFRERANDSALVRMSHYCGLGYAVEPWSVPA